MREGVCENDQIQFVKPDKMLAGLTVGNTSYRKEKLYVKIVTLNLSNLTQCRLALQWARSNIGIDYCNII